MSGSGTEERRQGMVRHLRVGFTVGHWVTNARTLSENAGKDNARGVNWGWTRGERRYYRKLLKLNILIRRLGRLGTSRFVVRAEFAIVARTARARERKVKHDFREKPR